jgi:hypothetical protein
VWQAESKFAQAPPAFWQGLRDISPLYAVFDAPFVTPLMTFQPFFPSCMMVDRAAFMAAGGWDEGVSRVRGCDAATSLRMAEQPPVGIVREVLAGIRKHTGNISGDVEATNLGDAVVLEYALRTRPGLQAYAPEIWYSIYDRRNAALASAFARRDFEAVRTIYALPPASPRPARTRLKYAISRLPRGLRELVANLLG